jgi:hypothetical protein
MAIGRFYLMKPSDCFSLYGDVSIDAGAVDTDYQAAWLTDGRPGRPVRATSGALTFTITNGSFTPGSLPTLPSGHTNKTLVVLANTNIVGATITVSGTISGSITAPTTQWNGINYSPYLLTTLTTLSTVTVAITGATEDVIIGEAMIGSAIELWPPPPPEDQSIEWNDFPMENAGGEFASVQPYYRGIESRKLTFTQYYNRTMLDELIKAQRSQRAGEQPLVIVPNSTINDAWVVYMAPVKYSVHAGGPSPTFRVELSFTEYPRSNW